MTHANVSRTRWLAGFGMATIVAAALVTGASPAAAEGTIAGAGQPNAIKDSYVVELAGGALRSQGVQTMAGTLASGYGATVQNTYQHAIHGFSATMSEAAARKLAADPRVARIQQNMWVSADDTQFSPPSYGLDRIDQRLRNYNGSYTYPNRGSGVVAYVLDTGIRVTHVEFGGRAVFGPNFIDTVNADCNGHGTHVAGTLGGANVGVAKAVSLISVKVLGCDGRGTTTSILNGLNFVIQHHVSGPAVANLSLGGPGAQPVLENAVRAAIADGVTTVIASGNDGADACNYSPARTAEAITVNATDGADARPAFSNFGACTDIFAPGVQIFSAGAGNDTGSAVMDGTSQATPHVAGAAALILAANPAFTPAQVAATLFGNATLGLVAGAVSGSPNRLLFVAHPAPPAPPAGPDHLIRGQALTANQGLRSANGLFTLIMQGDGNLVLYNQLSQAIWNLGTFGNPGAFLFFQGDGNVVLYRADGVPLWHTVTNGTAAYLFIVQSDSNIVLYGPAAQIYWRRV